MLSRKKLDDSAVDQKLKFAENFFIDYDNGTSQV